MGIQYGSERCHCELGGHAPRLVALTGGPGAGKTAVLEMAARSFCRHVAVLPEAASLLFGGGFPRPGTKIGLEAAQRAIFHVQREIEALVVAEARVAVALCDRGTLDGLAYWPNEPEVFWAGVGSSAEAELARYSSVIHLATPGADQGYDHSNPLRIESAKEAKRIDQRIMAAWRPHPRRSVIPSTESFLQKAARALSAVRQQLPPCCHTHEIPADETQP